MVPTAVFPKILQVYTEKLYYFVQLQLNAYIQNPSNVTLWRKEVICFVECLLLYCINGNPRNLTHRIFTTLGVRRSLHDFHLPYFSPQSFDFEKIEFKFINYNYELQSLLLSQNGQNDQKLVTSSNLILEMERIESPCTSDVTNFFGTVLNILFLEITEIVKKKNIINFSEVQQKILKIKVKTSQKLFQLQLNKQHFEVKIATVEEIFKGWVGYKENDSKYEPPLLFSRSGTETGKLLVQFKNLILGNYSKETFDLLVKLFRDRVELFEVLPEINSNGWTGKVFF